VGIIYLIKSEDRKEKRYRILKKNKRERDRMKNRQGE
jgi:hypothetical protein